MTEPPRGSVGTERHSGVDPGWQADLAAVDAFLARRDEAAFDRLYRRHTPKMWGMALRLCSGDEAEAAEVTQEAWSRAVGSLSGYRGESALSTWLCAIVLNAWREARRRRGREIGWDHAPEVEAPSLRPGATLDVTRALDRLPDGYRTVLLLFGVYGYSHEEIAEQLGIAVGTSKSQLSRARAALRLALT